MGYTLLNRPSIGLSYLPELNRTQQQLDEILSNFSDQVSDPTALAAMTVGSFAFRFAKLGFLEGAASSGLSKIVPRLFTKGAANLFALSTEVTAFRGTNQLLQSVGAGLCACPKGDGHGEPPLQEVFGQEWLGTFTDFAILKGIGHRMAGSNPLLARFAQDNAMVLGHQISANLGFTQHEEGSYFEKLAHAEITNLQLGLSMSLARTLAPRMTQAEKSLDIKNNAFEASTYNLRLSKPFKIGPPAQKNLVYRSGVEKPASSRVESELETLPDERIDVWGEKLFLASKSSWLAPTRWRSPLRVIQDRVLNEMLKDEATKKRMIAFLDVITNAPDALVTELLHDYFPQGGQNSQGLLRVALNLGNASWMPPSLIVWGIRLGLQVMANRFLAGETPEAALAQARQWRKKGIQATLDVVQENVLSAREADQYADTVLQLIREWKNETNIQARTKGGVPVRHISVKLSGLTHRFEPLAYEWATQEVQSRLLKIFKEAKASCDAGAPVMVNVDLEDYAVRDLSYDILWKTLNQPELKGWQDAAVVVQAYYKESASTLRQILENAEKYQKRIQVRMVKGAYHSFEQMRSARNGWEVPVFLSQAETDQNFRLLADMALQKHSVIHLAIGSHNLEDISYIQARREKMGIAIEEVEHQFLRGVGNHLASAVITLGIPARFYGPFGSKANGLGYMVRRLDEVKIDSAIGQTHISGSWKNYRRQKRNRPFVSAPTKQETASFAVEPETDFSRAEVRTSIAEALKKLQTQIPQKITPLLGNEIYPIAHELPDIHVNPGHWAQEVSHIWPTSPQEVQKAIAFAQTGYRQWSAVDQAERSATLNRAADSIHKHQYDIAALLVTEAGKPWQLALAEVHEGIDFLRAYAHDAKEVSKNRKALGVGVAISPFNFPFAIALGEVAGGLALGNAMILKPSEQTPAVGRLLVEILRKAGVPPEAVQFLPGTGKEVGEALVASPDIDFVVFTGSLSTATHIMENARLHPSARHGHKVVVTETGGKNAMIVDETADLDVAVKAILDGAFLMSGQRCSATSRVFVVDSVAHALMKRLVEGARSMIVGDAAKLETQIGPQIDELSFDKVKRYIKLGKEWGEPYEPGAHGSHPIGYYSGPTIFKGSDSQHRFAQEEIFGPLLAVMRVKNVDEAIKRTNDSPFGLTAGLISRSPTHITQFLAQIEAGNSYVNRSQVGAMVGRQPFGGAKDSGTGPQAGGPHYVARFGLPKNRMPPAQQKVFQGTPKVTALLDSSIFSGKDEVWKKLDPRDRIEFIQAAIRSIRENGLPAIFNAALIIQRLQAYAKQAEHLLRPQMTLPVPGEINEVAHDWPQGTGLLWSDKVSPDRFITDTLASLLMGNSVVLAHGPHSKFAIQFIQSLQKTRGGSWDAPVFLTSLSATHILNDRYLNFVVAEGPLANDVFAHFLPKINNVIGFRRAIGGSIDDPDDPFYLTRFASARTRTEETLRHGAELNLR